MRFLRNKCSCLIDRPCSEDDANFVVHYKQEAKELSQS